MPSNTTEDYLKAIYVLQEKEGRAKTGSLASQLGITAGSVTEMIKRMARISPALIDYRQHHGAVLTDDGRQVALTVIRRHRLLETFLFQVLGLGWEAVHAEAEILEHHVSERLVEAIDRHLGFPRTDPHGEPIPNSSGKIDELQGKQLTEFVPGTTFRIVRVDPSLDGMLAYLDELAIGLATIGVIDSQAPFNGPTTIRLKEKIGTRVMAVGREVANHIFVVPL